MRAENGLEVAANGLSVSSGGLVVTANGAGTTDPIVVAAGALSITATSSTTAALDVYTTTSMFTGNTIQSRFQPTNSGIAALALLTGTTPSFEVGYCTVRLQSDQTPSLYFIEAIISRQKMLNICGLCTFFPFLGDVLPVRGLCVCLLHRCVFVCSQVLFNGMVMTNNGLSVAAGVTVASGLLVNGGIDLIQGNIAIDAGPVSVTSSSTTAAVLDVTTGTSALGIQGRVISGAQNINNPNMLMLLEGGNVLMKVGDLWPWLACL